jgi:RNA polymerase sigma factor (sigma-70 family)
MLATIRRLVPADDVMDVFATVCASLSENDCARLRTYSATSQRAASFATWLVAVVRNVAVDWLRRTERRPRIAIPDTISALQREIFLAVCLEGASYVEAYESLRTRSVTTLSFSEFLRELRALNRAAPCPNALHTRTSGSGIPAEEMVEPASLTDSLEASEAGRRLAAALATQADDVRVAVQLFVVERLSAAEVARIVGWPNEKTVYNRVYRALAALRVVLEREGIEHSGDLL